MRIYLAARYSRIRELREYRNEIENLGHIVTSTWLDGEHEATDTDMLANVGLAGKHAMEDVLDVMRSDCLISFTEVPKTETRGGRHAEFGIAVAMRKRLILVGPMEHIFHCLPEVEVYNSWEEMRVKVFFN